MCYYLIKLKDEVKSLRLFLSNLNKPTTKNYYTHKLIEARLINILSGDYDKYTNIVYMIQKEFPFTGERSVLKLLKSLDYIKLTREKHGVFYAYAVEVAEGKKLPNKGQFIEVKPEWLSVYGLTPREAVVLGCFYSLKEMKWEQFTEGENSYNYIFTVEWFSKHFNIPAQTVRTTFHKLIEKGIISKDLDISYNGYDMVHTHTVEIRKSIFENKNTFDGSQISDGVELSNSKPKTNKKNVMTFMRVLNIILYSHGLPQVETGILEKVNCKVKLKIDKKNLALNPLVQQYYLLDSYKHVARTNLGQELYDVVRFALRLSDYRSNLKFIDQDELGQQVSKAKMHIESKNNVFKNHYRERNELLKEIVKDAVTLNIETRKVHFISNKMVLEEERPFYEDESWYQ